MKKIIFLFAILASCFCRLQAQSRVIPVSDAVLFVLYLKANKVDIQNCPDDFIVHAWHFLGGGRTDFPDEFVKKRYADGAKDSILSAEKQYTFADVYTYTAVRLIGTYNFDKHFFPILENNQMSPATGEIDHDVTLNSVTTKVTINDVPITIELQPVSRKLDFSLRLEEGPAEKFIGEKDSIYKETIQRKHPLYLVYSDGLGNTVSGKDRRIFLKYYIRIEDKPDPYFSENVYSKDIYADIQKIEAYLDEDCKNRVAVIYP